MSAPMNATQLASLKKMASAINKETAQLATKLDAMEGGAKRKRKTTATKTAPKKKVKKTTTKRKTKKTTKK